MSKALGCKRVHDDRIAGVTFEEIALCNALIVNEEYAWVGNPFSDRRNRKRESRSSLFLFLFFVGMVDYLSPAGSVLSGSESGMAG